MELQHLKEVFININGYPNWIVKQTINEVREYYERIQRSTEEQAEIELPITEKKKDLWLKLPYRGREGETVIRKLKNNIKKTLPQTNTKVVFTGKRLTSKFKIKDDISKEHKHNLVYEVKCPDCNANYIGETGKRLSERANEHSKDVTLHVFCHSQRTNHSPVTLNDFTILSNGFKNSFNRKVYIKHRKPSLNVQGKSVPIKLFN